MSQKKSVLMICLGNICRSPIAEAVFIDQINKLGVTDSWDIESAALIGYHTGKGPDRRAMSVLRNKGITDYSHKARPITQEDFNKFDWIFGMDHDNISELNDMKPSGSSAKIELLGKYDPEGEIIIRDPYYDSNDAGFYKAYDQCVRSVQAFLKTQKVFLLKGECSASVSTPQGMYNMSEKKMVLMICLGNSCRSPIAEAVFLDSVKKMGLSETWAVDSAALLTYHVGKDPEPRAVSTLKKHGITDYSHTARLITVDDFYKFNWIFGMDRGIVYDICQMQPSDSHAIIELLGKYDPEGETDIRDPIFDTGRGGFEKAFKQATRSIKSFLENNTGCM